MFSAKIVVSCGTLTSMKSILILLNIQNQNVWRMSSILFLMQRFGYQTCMKTRYVSTRKLDFFIPSLSYNQGYGTNYNGSVCGNAKSQDFEFYNTEAYAIHVLEEAPSFRKYQDVHIMNSVLIHYQQRSVSWKHKRCHLTLSYKKEDFLSVSNNIFRKTDLFTCSNFISHQQWDCKKHSRRDTSDSYLTLLEIRITLGIENKSEDEGDVLLA